MNIFEKEEKERKDEIINIRRKKHINDEWINLKERKMNE